MRSARARLARAALAAVALLAAAAPAHAVFPGRPGDLVYSLDGDIYRQPPVPGAEPVRLTWEGGELPTWSPDGTRIAYISRRGPFDQDIWVMRADGSEKRQLTDTIMVAPYHLTWSPDGRRIAYVTKEVGSYVSVLTLDGDFDHIASGGGEWFDDLVWSPDGSRLAFNRVVLSSPVSDSAVWTMAPDASDQRRITEGRFPQWSPDGSRLLVTRGGWDGPETTWSVPANGGEATFAFHGRGAFAPDGSTYAIVDEGDRRLIRWSGADEPLLETTGTLGGVDWQALPPSPGPQPAGQTTQQTPADATTSVTRAAFRVTWRRSAARGRLVVEGVAGAAGQAEISLLRGRRTVATARLTLPTGTFRHTLAVPAGLVPGTHVVRVRTADGAEASLPVTLRPPGPGIARHATAGRAPGGRLAALFRFTALPRRGVTLTTRWLRNGRPVGLPTAHPRRAAVRTAIRPPRLTPGRWTCVLRAGDHVVATATVRVGRGVPG